MPTCTCNLRATASLTCPASNLSSTVYHPRSPSTSSTPARTPKNIYIYTKQNKIKQKTKKKGKPEPLQSSKSHYADLLMGTLHCKSLKRTLHCTSLIYRRSLKLLPPSSHLVPSHSRSSLAKESGGRCGPDASLAMLPMLYCRGLGATSILGEFR